jgi:hypothetical protein
VSKQKWELTALTSLEFFVTNPEFKSEFGHQYFADRCGVTRMTLSRNKKYMKRFNEVKEILKGVKLASSTNTNSRITSYKEKVEDQKVTIAEKNKELEALKLRLNDCYQMLEDQGIDPQFVVRPRLKKHMEA